MLTMQDIVCPEDQLNELLSRDLLHARKYNRLTKAHGSKLVFHSFDDLEYWPREDAARYLLAFAKHKQKLIDSVPEFVLNAASDPIKWAERFTSGNYDWLNEYYGLKSVIQLDDVLEKIQIRVTPEIQSAIDRWFAPQSESVDPLYCWTHPDYSGEPLLRRAWSNARYQMLLNSGFWFSNRFRFQHRDGVKYLNSHMALRLLAMDAFWVSARPIRASVLAERNRILEEQRAGEAQSNLGMSRSSQDNFKNYWEGMKLRVQQLVDANEVRSAFDSIPILPAGTESSGLGVLRLRLFRII